MENYVELIKGLSQVKDALSLTAFLALILLLAFRTKQVPELFFGLVRDKLTRQQFARLLHRFMTLTFVAFLALLALAVVSQVLSHMTTPSAVTIDDLRNELAKTNQSVENKIHAEAQYSLAMEKLRQRDFDGAIAALSASIKAVPTLAAKEMLIYLHRQKGDLPGASEAWEEAVKAASERGDALALTRLDNIVIASGIPSAEGQHDLIGSSEPMPKGSDRYETAPMIGPGLYACSDSDGCSDRWFAIDLGAGQDVEVKFRSPSSGGPLAGASLYGTNGEILASAGDELDTMRGAARGRSVVSLLDWVAKDSGRYYLRIYADKGAVYHVRVR